MVVPVLQQKMDSLCNIGLCYCSKGPRKHFQTKTECASAAIIKALQHHTEVEGASPTLKLWLGIVKETCQRKLSRDSLRCQAKRLMKIHSQHKEAIIYAQQQPLEENPIDDSMTVQQDEQRSVTISDISIQGSTSDFVDEFITSVRQYANTACFVCDRLMYSNGLRKTNLNRKTVAHIREMCPDFVDPKYQVHLCHRCYNHNCKGKIPAQAKWNLMLPDHVPEEIAELSDIETALISQVKPFMKIYHLSRGRGQYGIKGGVIHFPQCVEEVYEQLPLAAENTDIIIVNQVLENLESRRQFSVRPNVIKRALDWLRIHNPLYSHIHISEDNLKRVNLTNVVSTCTEINSSQSLYPQGSMGGYEEISTSTKILRGTMHQSSPLFQDPFTGIQCTAMAAAAIAMASVQDPLTWTTSNIDGSLICGHAYFGKQNRLRSPENQSLPMNTDEIEGTVDDVFGTLSVSITQHLDSVIYGMLNKFKPKDRHVIRLSNALSTFFQSTYRYAILTCNGYSMALIHNEDMAYMYDSHSRGARGGVSLNGTACMLSFAIGDAPKEISSLIHRNIQPKRPVPNSERAVSGAYTFCITPIRAEMEDSQLGSDAASPTIAPCNERLLPPFDCAEIDETHLGSDSASPTIAPCNERLLTPLDLTETLANIRNNGEIGNCVFHSIDYAEPELDEVLQDKQGSFFLKRKTSAPINKSTESRLEELSFLKLFPYGRNGEVEMRCMRQTPLEYFQARVMSSDLRFSDTSYLFYALCIVEDYQVRKKVQVCCEMTRERDDNEAWAYDPQNVHLVLKSIRGTASYWKSYCSQTLAMCRQLGAPTFFFTFSYDDMNSWDSINAMYKRLNGFDVPDIDPQTLSYDEKKYLLDSSPITAARHFNYRVKLVFKLLKKHSECLFGYGMKDFTYRVEFQNRGSGHVHSLIWLEGAPKFQDDEFIAFVDRNTTCTLESPLKHLVMKYQSHHHSPTCFKRNSRSCRFNFPRQVTAETCIATDSDVIRNRGRTVVLRRNVNEAYINNYHPQLLQALQSNMDIQVVTDETSVAYYIAKYISKAEPAEVRREVREGIQQATEVNNETGKQRLQRQLRKIMRKREVGAQEASYRLCHLPLYFSSRACVFVPTFKPNQRTRMINKESLRKGEPEFCLNVIERYTSRPRNPLFEHICLYEFAAMFQPAYRTDYMDDSDAEEEFPEDFSSGQKFALLNNKGFVKARTEPAVVRYMYFNPIEDPESYFYSLLLLYLPFRHETFVDTYESSAAAFQALHQSLRTAEQNPIININFTQELDRCIAIMAENLLRNEQNSSSIQSDITSQAVLSLFDEADIVGEAIPLPSPPLTTANHMQAVQGLCGEQRAVFNSIINAVSSGKKGLRIVAMGSGGVGKSHLIRVLCQHIRMLTAGTVDQPVLLTAPTGVAAKNIGGITLHKALSLPVEKGSVIQYRPLKSKQLTRLRALIQQIKLFVIDEFSFLSYEFLRTVHCRFQEICENDELFGNVNMFFVGDLLQLRCVKGNYIFSRPPCYSHEPHLWRTFQIYELSVNHRQGNDPLLSVCNALRIGKLTLEHIELLKSREINPGKPNYAEMMGKFKDALHIFPTNKLVKRHNDKCAIALKRRSTVYPIRAIDTYADGPHSGEIADEACIPSETKNCAGIACTLNLGIGSRVMLLRNFDVQGKLCNGSLGTVIGFRWQCLRQNPRHDSYELPAAVEVQFEGATSHLLNERGNFEVLPQSFRFPGSKDKNISRLQLPLAEAFAVNVHKVQSLTLDRAVVYLGKRHFVKAQQYVALSRVRSLDGLAVLQVDASKLTRNVVDERVLAELERLRTVQNRARS